MTVLSPAFVLVLIAIAAAHLAIGRIVRDRGRRAAIVIVAVSTGCVRVWSLRGSAEGGLCWGGVEDRGWRDRAGVAARSVLGLVGSVEEMAAVDECGGAAAVQVDGLAGAEAGHDLGELGESESCVDAGPPAVTDECDQVVIGGTECGSWVAAGGDVWVELVGGGA